MRLEWHTHASRLGVDLDPPGLDHLLLPSVCKHYNLNSNNHFGLPTPDFCNPDSKNLYASILGLLSSQNLMYDSGGGERLINYNNYKSYENLRKSTKNLWADRLSVEIILDTLFYFIFFDSVISMILYLMAIFLHTLHFSHYFLLQQRKCICGF
jgi:hypothetical protein